ncbi:TetR/AcrR family transcriptional regulator [Paenibacillus sacheonensis]|uniref:TetR family transcriptional regulator n=1 Tax=Paenibacillus sacheonensis TaxID=742054 RepID=A0A7X5C2H0_9BACL|nr:TetR/AcrR family transcriptional regulator [Paenibacillus sacheonensis]MBM7567632.1 AcrR family transcriptional regulator [Paenibacillus sacheonensis]NBC71265.1 TetR family transcriptional regulator [Paenibacillus sacheonensis]
MEKKLTAKERILRVAEQLFYREGVRAVGIDRIIQESGVAKASFYRNFATKDDLVVAYLELHRERVMGNIAHARQQRPDSVLAQLRYLMEYTADRMKLPTYRGCAFMNTAVEFPETDHPDHVKALDSRNEVWNHIEDMAREAGLPKPRELTEQLRMLWSGAAMVAYINKEEFKPQSFSDAANALIDSQAAAAAK